MNTSRLFFPATDAGIWLDLDEAQLKVVRWIAERGGSQFVYREDTVNKKVYLRFPNDGRKPIDEAAATAAKALAMVGSRAYLPTPLQSQYDSATASGYRMCWTSTGTMLVEGVSPGILRNHPQRHKNEQLDDFYYRMLKENGFGDTTNPLAHLAMAKWLGLKGHYHQDGKMADLEALLLKGTRVGCGVLHHGHWTAPTGDGHWIELNGFKAQAVISCDPAGKMDIENGGYGLGLPGKDVAYDRKMFQSRWMVHGTPGWYYYVTK